MALDGILTSYEGEKLPKALVQIGSTLDSLILRRLQELLWQLTWNTSKNSRPSLSPRRGIGDEGGSLGLVSTYPQDPGAV